MELQELIHRVKQLEKVMLILAVIIAIGIVYLAWPNKNTISADEQKLARQMTIMIAHDKERDSTIHVLEYRVRQDSLHIVSVKSQVGEVPAMMTRINNRYNDKRNHITTLSADEQLQLFSDWLSTQDSL